MLREPSGHFGGYVWTFAKGRADPGESPEATALREVREEMGITAEIIAPVPGCFIGDTSVTQFFLMHYIETVTDELHETTRTRWASLAEAQKLVQLSTTPKGVARDLAILDPPYEARAMVAPLRALVSHLMPGAPVVIKHFWRTELPDIGGLTMTRQRRFGETMLTFLAM